MDDADLNSFGLFLENHHEEAFVRWSAEYVSQNDCAVIKKCGRKDCILGKKKRRDCETCGKTFCPKYDATAGYHDQPHKPKDWTSTWEKYEASHCCSCALTWHKEQWDKEYAEYQARRVERETTHSGTCDNPECAWYRFFYEHSDNFIGPASGDVYASLREQFKQQGGANTNGEICSYCGHWYDPYGPNIFEATFWFFNDECDSVFNLKKEDVCPECMLRDEARNVGKKEGRNLVSLLFSYYPHDARKFIKWCKEDPERAVELEDMEEAFWRDEEETRHESKKAKK